MKLNKLTQAKVLKDELDTYVNRLYLLRVNHAIIVEGQYIAKKDAPEVFEGWEKYLTRKRDSIAEELKAIGIDLEESDLQSRFDINENH